MPPVRRSETAPRKSSRVASITAEKAAADRVKQDREAAERKKEAAEARKAAAAKSKGKKKPAARRAPAKPRATKRKASSGEEDDDDSGSASGEDQPAPKKRGPPAKRDAGEPEAKQAGRYSVGDVVEDVKLKNQDDEEVSLAELYKDNGLVIFSYPKANTPGCTTQACNFRDTKSAFAEQGFTVLGLSKDKPSAQLSWQAKHELGYSLLCDVADFGLLKKLGATESQKRCHFIIEKGGKLLEAKIGVKPADDAKNALEFVKSLSLSGDEKAEDAAEEKEGESAEEKEEDATTADEEKKDESA
ncbi:hypothetical protein JCM10213_000393 [Rhodosporidiobolus nylandii]